MKVKGMARILSAVMTLTCISFPPAAKAETIETTDANGLVSVAKENLFNGDNWGDYINTFAYGVGAATEYMDYGNCSKSTFATDETDNQKVWSAELNDNTLTDDQLMTRPDGWKGAGKKSNPIGEGETNQTAALGAGMIEKETGWGYRGFSPFWRTQQVEGDNGNKITVDAETNYYPAGIVDASSYADNAVVSYVIDADGQDISDVYLTVGYHKDLWDLGWYWEGDMESTFSYGSTYLDADKLDEINATNGTSAVWRRGTGNYRTIRFAGVKLSDYYDETVGGFQRINVPMSEFKDHSVFNKKAGKIQDADVLSPDDHTNTFNPALIKTVGIARKDSNSEKTYTSKIKAIEFAAISAPTDFTVEKQDDGSAYMYWEAVNSDVTYKIKKTADGEVSYLNVDEGEAEYTDEDVDLTDTDVEVKYQLIAENATYDLTAKTDEIVLNETVETTAFKERVFDNWGWGNNFTIYSYAVGYDGNWCLDYKSTGGEAKSGVQTILLNDNTLTEEQFTARPSGMVSAGKIGNPQSDEALNMIEPITGWGYRGFSISYSSNNADKYLGGVIDASAYADTASVSYNIDVTDQDIDDVYLVIGYFANLKDLGFADEKYSEIYAQTDLHDTSKLEAINANWKKGEGNWVKVSFAGVPLKDYYDTAKGGYQRITVPFSEFANNSKFNKAASHSWRFGLSADDHTNTFNPALIKTVGIARKDSKNAEEFTAMVKDYSIVAPAAVRDFQKSYDKETGAVKLSWKDSTEKNISKVEVVKSVNGVKTYIDVTGENSYSDTLDTASNAEVRYSVVLTETEYGATASTEELVVNERVATKSFKKSMVNANGASWSYDLSAMGGYVGGPTNIYGDYASETLNDTVNKILTTSINDNTLSAEQLDSNGNNPIISGDSNPAKGMIEPKTGWGFKGMQIEAYANSGYPCGVIDLLDYKDGYAIFNIRIDEGELDGVYASIVYANSLIDINTFYSDTHTVYTEKNLRNTELLDATYGTDAWKNKSSFVKYRIAGVKLSDYYDMEKGGFQTVKIPLKKFTESPDFRATYNKGALQADETETSTMNLNLGLVKGIGISRKDTDPNKVSKFTFSVKDYAFAAHKPAETLTVQKTSSGAKLSWLKSTDTDVTQKLVKIVNRNKIYIDVEGSEYLDTAAGDNEITYYIETSDSAYGATMESNRVYYNSPEEQDEIVIDFKAGTSKDNDNLSTDSDGNALAAIPKAWYTSSSNTVSEWGEYADYWNGQPGEDDGNKVEKFWLVDNNYTHTWVSYGTDRGRIVKDAPYTPNGGTAQPAVSHEYGLAGYEFNEGVGTIKDISAHKDGYLIMDVKFLEPNGGTLSLDGAYFTVEFAKSAWDIAGNESDVWNYGAKRLHNSIVRGVPVSDYYDAAKGGYQTVVIPLSAFTNAEEPELKYVKTREQNFASLYADDQTKNYDFADYMMAFKGAGVARKNFSANSGIAYYLNEMYIADTASPRELKATLNGTNIDLTWKEAAVSGVSKYEVYRDGKKLATVDGLAYTDKTASGGTHTYAVKTVSPTYDGVVSSAVTATAVIPVLTDVKIYAGTGSSRTEAKYVSAGTMEVDLTALASGTQGYAALYDANGVLKAVKTVALASENAKTVQFTNVLATDTLKAFIWNGKQVPECDEVTVSARGTRLLVIGDEVAAETFDYVDEVFAAEGKNVNVTVAYEENATIHTHYTNLSSDEATYTKSVNGVNAANKVALNDVLSEGDWDYILIQDKNAYEGVTVYDTDDEDLIAEMKAFGEAIKAKAGTAKVYANETLGFDEVYYGTLSDAVQTEINEITTITGWADSNDIAYFAPVCLCEYLDKIGTDGYVDTFNVLMYYEGEAKFVNGQTPTSDGKFAAAAYIYKAVTGGYPNAASAPSAVTDAAGILDCFADNGTI